MRRTRRCCSASSYSEDTVSETGMGTDGGEVRMRRLENHVVDRDTVQSDLAGGIERC